ncbi:MAG: regulatory iron-sulfur-containing complex subunit RicT [Bacteroidota bacterium]|nr:regulatory iron-sulfur-containing complex subunit RicT [Bacteroidota bacterium]
MGCSSGCGTESNGIPKGCNNNGSCGTESGCNKLTVFDWLGNMNLPDGQSAFPVLEIRFKNSRKEYYKNVNNLPLNVGDAVAVEASSGHDIGIVSLTGELVKLQLKKRNISLDSEEIKKIYRKAKQNDIDKWKEAQALEVDTMYKARTIALKLGLAMKLSDVEYQGDKSKAVFYYTAEARVDFRELIKVLAVEFGVRIEMRQIGARQEASRLGGIGACGRELCCSTWLTDFRAVSTSAARYQQLSLNPLKLAGQCGKLKCCLNYELDSYLDALKEFPEMEGKRLQTKKGDAFLQKTDIFKRTMYFSYRSEPDVFIPLNVTAVKEVLEANAKGELPDDFKVAFKETSKVKVIEHNFENVVGQDSLTRFDKTKGNKQGNNRNHPHKNNQHKKPNQQKTQGQNNKPNPNQVKTNSKVQPTANVKPQTSNNNRKPHHNRNKHNKPNNDANKTTPTE